jgi:hypothetical protein
MMKIRSGGGVKHLLLYGCVIAAMLALAAPALADTIIGSSASYDWRGWTTAGLNENGIPYWDHTSLDGSHMNIGYYMTNTGGYAGCSSNCGPGSLPFWGGAYTPGTGGAVADPNFYFTKTDHGQLAALTIEIAGHANTNVFGWFETNSTGTTTGATHVLFTGPQGAGASANFVPTAYYGYYMTTASGQTFYTLSSSDIIGQNPAFQHFAIFKEGDPSYWIGVEDLSAGSDRDYNDMVIHVTATSPEPGSLVLLGSGLVGIGIVLRRRFLRR